MNLYQLHNQATQLVGFATATESVPKLAWDYYKNKKKELRKREHLWAQDPYTAYRYAQDVLQSPFPLGEPAIAEDPKRAFRYAHDVLQKRRFPEGEPAIAQDPHLAYYYAQRVLQGPFPHGEPAIAQNPELAHWYAFNVLQAPFPLGEPAIAQVPKRWKQYLQQFPERRPKTKTEKKS